MSRIANAPVTIPKGVEASLSDGAISVKGSKGNFFSGSDDWVRFLVNLAYNNPDDNFFIIWSSDFSKLMESVNLMIKFEKKKPAPPILLGPS